MDKIEKRIKLIKIEKWILRTILITFAVFIIYCLWPFVLMLGIYGIALISIAIPILFFFVLIKAYKYYSNKNKP